MYATASSPWKKKAGEYRSLSSPHQPSSFNLKSVRLKPFFSPPPSSDYDSSQGPDKKKTVYQMALSKKSLSPLLLYSKRVLLDLEGTGGRAHWSPCVHVLWFYFVLALSASPHVSSALPLLCRCFRQTGRNLGRCSAHYYIRQPGPEGSWRQEGPQQEYCP